MELENLQKMHKKQRERSTNIILKKIVKLQGKIQKENTELPNYQKYTPINNHFKSQSKVSQSKDMVVDRIKIKKTYLYAAYKRCTSELQKPID